MTIENKRLSPITLPALRGMMGNRAFYSCLMSFEELARRVSYADEVHQNKSLSDMIQRELQSRRIREISDYLREQPERFFNSLVIATYGGDPNWHALSSVNGRRENDALANLTEETIGSVGFLTLNGDEKLFAVDGQHRLAGIKRFVANQDESTHDEVSVIFVAHQETPEGLQRTRRLFTTLNKTARPVSKGGIIALDEDDVMAICVRRLVEETNLFDGEKVAFVANNNLPTTNMDSLTTIGNLYDVLAILFTQANTEIRNTTKANLQRIRPNDGVLDDYFNLATRFFSEIGANFEEVGEFFSAPNTMPVVEKHRGRHGGSVMFRPIGLDMFVRIVAQLTATMELSEAIQLAAKLPRSLTEAPYAGLMWDISTSTISNAHRVTLREVLLRMLGRAKMSDADLIERYRRETGDEMAALPDRVV